MLRMLQLDVEQWRKVTLGQQPTPTRYREILKSKGFVVDPVADELLKQVDVEKKPMDVMLASGSVGELGFATAVSYARICQRIESVGYGLCPPEAGPAIRLMHDMQPYPFELRVAMRPLMVGSGPYIFSIRHLEGGRRLSASRASADILWPPEIRFVFTLPFGGN